MSVADRRVRVSSKDVLWIVIKWLLVPMIMAVLGFYLIGPRVGQVPAIEGKRDRVETLVRSTSPTHGSTETRVENVPQPIENERFGDLGISVTAPVQGSRVEPERSSTQTTERTAPPRSSRPEEEPSVTQETDTIPDTPPVDGLGNGSVEPDRDEPERQERTGEAITDQN